MLNKFIVLIACFFLNTSAWCWQEVYPWRSVEDAARFKQLTSELRCLVCQNQTIAESNAPLANDLRLQVFHKILQKQSNEQIRDFLVTRYGDYILYRPKVNVATGILWFGPFLLLGFGLFFLIFSIRKNKRE
jgi:cytochrome c-type biogenesis protein CcmH